MSIALGGCVRGEPVQYGITEDTGGHIAYILGEMRALARRPDVRCAEIVTRLFDEPELGPVHARSMEKLEPDCLITRIDSGDRRYLAKDDLRIDRMNFIRALLAELGEREHLPDLIHAHFADAADVAAHVQRALGIPYIYTAHSLGMDKLNAVGEPCDVLEMRIEEEDRAIARAVAVVGSSRDECERQLPAYPSARMDKVHRIIPGVDVIPPHADQIERARRLIAPFLRVPDKPIILAIARAVRKKNLASLIEAFAPIRSKANLVILAGQRYASNEGEDEQVEVITDLLHMIDKHDLYGSVAYPKRHSNGDVAGLYALAAQSRGLFVNPALVEPFGLTILEAAAHGLPVVATQIGGPVDTIGELQHGILIDPRSPTEISDAIQRLLDDEALWKICAANGAENSREIDWARYADSFIKLARSTLSGHASVEGRARPNTSHLFVSDLDNTLTGCAAGIERLRAFLDNNPGFAFVIATGRSFVEARRIAREWDIPEPVAWITSVGTEIHWNSGTRSIRDMNFPTLAKARWEPEKVDAIMARFPTIQPQPCYEQQQFKRSYYFSTQEKVSEIRSALRNADLPVRVIASHDRLLDILPLSAGKAAAMHHVASVLRIAPEKIFAAGDSGNDEDMLTECRNAIIVENHTAEIAKLTSRTNVYLAKRAHAAGAIEGVEATRLHRSTVGVAMSGVRK